MSRRLHLGTPFRCLVWLRAVTACFLLAAGVQPHAAAAAPLFAPEIPSRCDLSVVDVRLESSARAALGTTVRVVVTIRNLGNASAPPTKAACLFLASGIIPGRDARDIPALKPGASHVMQFAYQPTIAGQYRVEASVDTALFEHESNWRNDHLVGPGFEMSTAERTYPEAPASDAGAATVKP